MIGKSSITYTSLKILRIDCECTGIPLLHRHPSDDLLHPLVVRRSCLNAFSSPGFCLAESQYRLYLVRAYRNSKGRIGLLPYFWVGPVVIYICAIYHRIEGLVMLAYLLMVVGEMLSSGIALFTDWYIYSLPFSSFAATILPALAIIGSSSFQPI